MINESKSRLTQSYLQRAGNFIYHYFSIIAPYLTFVPYATYDIGVKFSSRCKKNFKGNAQDNKTKVFYIEFCKYCVTVYCYCQMFMLIHILDTWWRSFSEIFLFQREQHRQKHLNPGSLLNWADGVIGLTPQTNSIKYFRRSNTNWIIFFAKFSSHILKV